LPAGYLSTRGNQIVGADGKSVRIASVGWWGENDKDGAPLGFDKVNYKYTLDSIVKDGFNCIRLSWTNGSLHSSNPCKDIDSTLNPDLAGLTNMQVIDKMIQYAGTIGLKIVLDHHTDEGMEPHTDTQRNGLWYDVGPGTDGTDGDGAKGTVTAQSFVDDWVTVAKKYADNTTVIGFDLDNEPCWNQSNNLNWAGGGPTDIRAMFTNVGNALQAIDPGKLIICEGPGCIFSDRNSPVYSMMDLTNVEKYPVVLNTPNKVVYSVHEYPMEVNPAFRPDSGAGYIARMNEDWGYLLTKNIAPVWIGEMGAPVSSDSDTDGRAWIATLLDYINGKDGSQGGPTFRKGAQPVGTDWWYWGSDEAGSGWGTLSTWSPAVFVPYTQKITNQLLYK
jgi:aryl-phospho-beta-D-glucosidase BglC (GH1 family)